MANPNDINFGGPLTDAAAAAAESLPGRTSGSLLVKASDGTVRDATMADVTALTGLASGGWADVQALRMKAAISDLTGFEAYRTHNLPTSASWADSLDIPGGGKTIVQNSWAAFSGTIVVNPKTAKWALAGRLRHSGSYDSEFGLVNGNSRIACNILGTSTGLFNLLTTTDGTPHRTASALAMDTAFHDVMLTMDATALKLWVDGVTIASTTDLTYVSTSPHTLKCACYSSSTTLTITDVAYGFVRT